MDIITVITCLLQLTQDPMITTPCGMEVSMWVHQLNTLSCIFLLSWRNNKHLLVVKSLLSRKSGIMIIMKCVSILSPKSVFLKSSSLTFLPFPLFCWHLLCLCEKTIYHSVNGLRVGFRSPFFHCVYLHMVLPLPVPLNKSWHDHHDKKTVKMMMTWVTKIPSIIWEYQWIISEASWLFITARIHECNKISILLLRFFHWIPRERCRRIITRLWKVRTVSFFRLNLKCIWNQHDLL